MIEAKYRSNNCVINGCKGFGKHLFMTGEVSHFECCDEHYDKILPLYSEAGREMQNNFNLYEISTREINLSLLQEIRGLH